MKEKGTNRYYRQCAKNEHYRMIRMSIDYVTIFGQSVILICPILSLKKENF